MHLVGWFIWIMENICLFCVTLHSRVLFQHDIPYSLILPFHHCPQSALFRVTPTTAVNAIRALDLSGGGGFFFSPFGRFVLLACPFSILRISYVWWNSMRKIEFSNRFVCRSFVPAVISVATVCYACPMPTKFIYQWFSFLGLWWGWGVGREVCALVFLALPVC